MNWTEKPKRQIQEIEPSIIGKPEAIEKRKMFSKTFKIGKDKQGRDIFRMVNMLGTRVHYKDNLADLKESWKDIDLTLIKKGNNYYCDKTYYSVEVFTDRVGYSYTSKRGGNVIVELAEISGVPVDNSKINVVVDRNQLFWKGFNGIEFKVVLFPIKVELFKKLDSATSPRTLKWKVTEEKQDNCFFVKKSAGIDNKGNNLQMLSNVIGKIDLGSKVSYFYNEEWTGKVSYIINKKTRQKGLKDTSDYPIIIDATTTENIVTGADDVFSYTGTFGGSARHFVSTKTGVRGGNSGGYSYRPGFRFQSLGIPQGTTINSAVLKVVMDEAGSIGCKQKFYADNVDNAAAWSSNDGPKDITKTTAYKLWTWSAASGATTSAAITNVVQEIISRVGWVSGNNIRFAGFSNNATRNRVVQAYEKSGGTPASLVVDYASASTTYTQSLPVTETSLSSLGIISSFFKALSIVESSVISLSKAITYAKSLVITEVSNISINLVKSFYRTLSVVETSVIGLVKQMSKLFVVTEVSNASVLLVKTFYRTLLVIETSINQILRKTTKTLSVVEGTIATLTNRATHFMSLIVTEVSQASLIQKATHFVDLLTTEISQATLLSQQILGVTLSVIESSVVSLRKLIQKGLSVIESSIISLVRSVSAYRMLSVVETSIPSLVKKMGRTLAIVESSVAIMLKIRYVELAVQEISKVSLLLLKTFYRSLIIVESSVVSLAKSMSLGLTVVESSIVSLARTVSHYLTLSVAEISSVSLITIQTLYRSLTVVESSVVGLVKTVKKTLSVIELSVPNLSKLITHYISLVVTELSNTSLVKTLSSVLNTVESSVVSLARMATRYISLSIIENSIVSLTNVVGKVFTITETSVVSLTKVSTHYISLAVTEISNSTFGKVIVLSMNVVENSIVSLTRMTSRYITLSIIEVSNVSINLVKTFYRILSTASTEVASLTAASYRALVLSVVSTATATILTIRRKILAITESSIATMTNQIEHGIVMATNAIFKVWFFLNGRRVDDYRNKYSNTGGTYDDKYPASGDKGNYTNKY